MDTVTFLTTEHAKTLDGLHREIEKLQAHCNELTFKLNFSNNDDVSATEENVDSSNDMDTINSLKGQLEDVTHSLGTELHHKTEVIYELENQLLEAQRKIRVLSEKQRQSQTELESSSKAVAFLKSSLQQSKSKQSSHPINYPTNVSFQRISHEQKNRHLQPISSSAFFSEEEFMSPSFRSLPPSFDRMTSPKILVPTPPSELPKNRSPNPRYHRRYSAPRLRTHSVNESLPLALLPHDKLHLVPVPPKPKKKLVLPPIPNASRESHSRSGPMVGTLRS